MANQAGRKGTLKKGTTAIAGLRQKGTTVNGEPISVEDSDDDGFGRFLDGVMVNKTVALSGSGYEKDGILRAISYGPDSGKFMDDMTFEYEDGAVLAADFVLTAYNEGHAHDDGVSFDFVLTTNGPWTYTP